MKDIFPEYYNEEFVESDLARLVAGSALSIEPSDILKQYGYPGEEQVDKLWDDCVFVFDANALTHIFDMPEELSLRYLEVLNGFKDRLWIPHHAASEYHDHIIDAVVSSCRPYKDMYDLRGSLKEKCNKQVKTYRKWHWFDDSELSELYGAIDNLVETAKRNRDRVLARYGSLKESIAEVFDGKVGEPISESQKDEYTKEAEKRLRVGLPPACLEDSKKSENKYGDVFIWLSILDSDRLNGRDVLFITDDQKENWFLFDQKGLVGPRPELVHERARLSGRMFWACTSTAFIDNGQKILSLDRDDKVQKELKLAQDRESSDIKEMISIRDSWNSVLDSLDSHSYIKSKIAVDPLNRVLEYVQEQKDREEAIRNTLSNKLIEQFQRNDSDYAKSIRERLAMKSRRDAELDSNLSAINRMKKGLDLPDSVIGANAESFVEDAVTAEDVSKDERGSNSETTEHEL